MRKLLAFVAGALAVLFAFGVATMFFPDLAQDPAIIALVVAMTVGGGVVVAVSA